MEGAATRSGICVLTTRSPEVPVIVKFVATCVADVVAFKVSVEKPDVVAGENEAVTPSGRPVAESLALPVNPYSGLKVIVDVTLLPGFSKSDAGAFDRVKVGP